MSSTARATAVTIVLSWTLIAAAGDPMASRRPAHVQAIADQTENLRPEVLELALDAYEAARRSGKVRRPVLTVIDYELPSYERRLWVIDMTSHRVLYEEWVAHGMGKPRGSGGTMEEARTFSNTPGTLKSSLGLFVTAETYRG
ncbi:MAG TPA: murein L,D-transpeptidase catalytic domain family protein, partial [Chondromyces sp.]|nr:murein L,D-transpeptidase catalytic domain family protein [Chondromyces sp.]